MRLERVWKETVIFELKAASRNSVAATEECHGKNKLRLPDSESRLEVRDLPHTKYKRKKKKEKKRNVHISQHCAGLRSLHVVLPELFVMQ